MILAASSADIWLSRSDQPWIGKALAVEAHAVALDPEVAVKDSWTGVCALLAQTRLNLASTLSFLNRYRLSLQSVRRIYSGPIRSSSVCMGATGRAG